MTPFRAATGVVDRLQGFPLPESITLNAVVLTKRPNPDGVGFDPADIVSSDVTSIDFVLDRQRLVNKARVTIYLVEGSWQALYLQLYDMDGQPYGKGVAALGGEAAHWLEAAPDMISITARQAI